MSVEGCCECPTTDSKTMLDDCLACGRRYCSRHVRECCVEMVTTPWGLAELRARMRAEGISVTSLVIR